MGLKLQQPFYIALLLERGFHITRLHITWSRKCYSASITRHPYSVVSLQQHPSILQQVSFAVYQLYFRRKIAAKIYKHVSLSQSCLRYLFLSSQSSFTVHKYCSWSSLSKQFFCNWVWMLKNYIILQKFFFFFFVREQCFNLVFVSLLYQSLILFNSTKLIYNLSCLVLHITRYEWCDLYKFRVSYSMVSIQRGRWIP